MLRVLRSAVSISRLQPAFRNVKSNTILKMSASSAPIAAAAGAEKVTWKRADGSEVPGYVYGKAAVGNPGIVVMQEWWGVDRDVLHHAKKIADRGYRTLVPDLYRGVLGLEAEEAHHLFNHLDWAGAIEDIRGAAKYLKTAEGSAKVGVTGFCMGGALTLASGVLVDEVDAVVPFYGIPSPSLADVSKIKKPVQAHFGDKDGMAGFSDPVAVNALVDTLKDTGVEHEVHRYPTVGHAFMNETPDGISRRLKLGQGEHDQAAVDLAWSRLFTFFGKHLH